MPYDKSVAYSESTRLKQKHVEEILRVHMRVTKRIWARAKARGLPINQEYLYIDLNAGSGVVNGAEGSPCIFVRLAAEEQIPYRAWFFEENAAALQALRTALLERRALWEPWGTISIIPGDHNKTVPHMLPRIQRLPATTYGLIYADPNGTLLETEPIIQFVRQQRLRFMDVLTYITAISYKRTNGSYLATNSTKPRYTFMDYLYRIAKQYIWIREPAAGTFQFTLAVLSDWQNFPDFRYIGLHRTDTDAGARILRSLVLTKREKKLVTTNADALRVANKLTDIDMMTRRVARERLDRLLNGCPTANSGEQEDDNVNEGETTDVSYLE